MRAITTGAVWAWAIVNAGKDVENLPPTSPRIGALKRLVGQDIAIHAAGTVTRAQYDDSVAYVGGVAAAAGRQIAVPPRAEIQVGAIVAIARIVKVCSADRLDSTWAFSGDVGILLADVRPLAQPVRYKGALHVFEVPDRIIRRALGLLPAKVAPSSAVRAPTTAAPAWRSEPDPHLRAGLKAAETRRRNREAGAPTGGKQPPTTTAPAWENEPDPHRRAGLKAAETRRRNREAGASTDAKQPPTTTAPAWENEPDPHRRAGLKAAETRRRNREAAAG